MRLLLNLLLQKKNKVMPAKYYQRYSQPGWKETTLEDIKKDFNVEPKIKDGKFYYVELIGRDYNIVNEDLRCVFFDHTSKTFLYLKCGNQQISEDSVFKSEEEAMDIIRQKEKMSEGHSYISSLITGMIIKEF